MSEDKKTITPQPKDEDTGREETQENRVKQSYQPTVDMLDDDNPPTEDSDSE